MSCAIGGSVGGKRSRACLKVKAIYSSIARSIQNPKIRYDLQNTNISQRKLCQCHKESVLNSPEKQTAPVGLLSSFHRFKSEFTSSGVSESPTSVAQTNLCKPYPLPLPSKSSATPKIGPDGIDVLHDRVLITFYLLQNTAHTLFLHKNG